MARAHDYSDLTSLERLPSGIPGLDVLLSGGFFRAGLYVIQGAPGTGKTIFGNQLCFHHAASGESALYVTLLTESHHRMLSHLHGLDFVDTAQISRSIHYLSAFQVLENEGLPALLHLLRREIVARRASLLVLDGLLQAGEPLASGTELKQLIQGLQAQASATDCTVFLLTSAQSATTTPEHTMVDGAIVLSDVIDGWIARRHLTITKFRGSTYVRGQHALVIDGRGITVFPRLETAFGGQDAGKLVSAAREPTGVAGLDTMLGGGLPGGSCTLLAGPVGVGKTTMGLQFLASAAPGQRGLHYGFYEKPPALLRKVADLFPSLHGMVQAGDVSFHWQQGAERLLDDIGHELLDSVGDRDVDRLVVDGLGAFDRLSARSNRLGNFFTALTNELRSRGVCAIFTLEVPDWGSLVSSSKHSHLTQFADNLILLRYTEASGRLQRLISVLKIRDSGFDPMVREFEIAADGIKVHGAALSRETTSNQQQQRNRERGSEAQSGSRRNRGL